MVPSGKRSLIVKKSQFLLEICQPKCDFFYNSTQIFLNFLKNRPEAVFTKLIFVWTCNVWTKDQTLFWRFELFSIHQCLNKKLERETWRSNVESFWTPMTVQKFFLFVENATITPHTMTFGIIDQFESCSPAIFLHFGIWLNQVISNRHRVTGAEKLSPIWRRQTHRKVKALGNLCINGQNLSIDWQLLLILLKKGSCIVMW